MKKSIVLYSIIVICSMFIVLCSKNADSINNRNSQKTKVKEYDSHVILTAYSPYYLNNNKAFSPLKAFDGKLDTCWAVENNKKEKSIELSVNARQLVYIKKVGIFPGFGIFKGKYGNLFKRNCRVKSVIFRINDYESSRNKSYKKVILKDEPRMQYFDLNIGSVFTFKIEILEVYPGNQDKDICISEIDIVLDRDIKAKKDYSSYIKDSYGEFIGISPGALFFKSDNKLEGGFSDTSASNNEIIGKWRLKNDRININYKVQRYIGNQKVYKGPYSYTLFIKGLLDEKNLLIFSEPFNEGKVY